MCILVSKIYAQLANSGRAVRDNAAGLGERIDLVVSTTLATGNNRTSVTHATARGSSTAGNERHHRLGVREREVVLLEVLGSILLHRTADLTNDHDTLGLGVLEEELDHVSGGRTREGVTTDTDDERLAETDLGGLVHSLVREGTRARHNTNAAGRVNVAGHDTDLAALGVDHTRAVGTDHARLALVLKSVGDTDLVLLGNSLGNGNDERDLGINSLNDRVSRGRRGDVEHGCVGVSLLDRVLHRREYGLLWRHTTNDVGTVRNGLLTVERALVSRDAPSCP